MSEKRCVYKCGAWNCGSYQFNLYKDAIDQGELCDVHYWQTKAQRPWVGLTEDDLNYLCHLAYTGDEEFALTVQAMLKEKNT
jgi:hypothetical protein